MDGPSEYHTKWNKSDRERQISYDITYMWDQKTDLFTKSSLFTKNLLIKQTHRHRKQTYGYQKGRDKLGVWD